MSFLTEIIKKQPILYRIARASKHRLMGKPEAELDLLPILVDPNRIAVDIGAHSGLYSEALSKIATHVIAVEAIPPLAQNLQRLLPHVEVINAAISDKDGEITLAMPEGHLGLASVAHANFAGSARVNKINVPARSLDSILQSRSDAVGFIKIDVEGHELAVLEGARKTIASHRPVMLIEAEERHQLGTVKALFNYFSDLNYSGFFLDGILRSLESFDSSTHQNISDADIPLLDTGQYTGRYCNNFVFIP